MDYKYIIISIIIVMIMIIKALTKATIIIMMMMIHHVCSYEIINHVNSNVRLKNSELAKNGTKDVKLTLKWKVDVLWILLIYIFNLSI